MAYIYNKCTRCILYSSMLVNYLWRSKCSYSDTFISSRYEKRACKQNVFSHCLSSGLLFLLYNYLDFRNYFVFTLLILVTWHRYIKLKFLEYVNIFVSRKLFIQWLRIFHKCIISKGDSSSCYECSYYFDMDIN